MISCWKNDPDVRPTFTDLRNQLKDMETLHKVRLVVNITTFVFPFMQERMTGCYSPLSPLKKAHQKFQITTVYAD